MDESESSGTTETKCLSDSKPYNMLYGFSFNNREKGEPHGC